MKSLITADEVKKAARSKGFPAGVVEKDYALNWLLYGVYNSELKDVLAFKGGTALALWKQNNLRQRTIRNPYRKHLSDITFAATLLFSFQQLP